MNDTILGLALAAGSSALLVLLVGWEALALAAALAAVAVALDWSGEVWL